MCLPFLKRERGTVFTEGSCNIVLQEMGWNPTSSCGCSPAPFLLGKSEYKRLSADFLNGLVHAVQNTERVLVVAITSPDNVSLEREHWPGNSLGVLNLTSRDKFG